MEMTIKRYPVTDGTMPPGPLTLILGAPATVTAAEARAAIVEAYDEETYRALIERLDDNHTVVITTASDMYEVTRAS